jgi:hypothetical protein
VTKVSSINTDESIKSTIYSILDLCDLSKDQKNKMKLTNIDAKNHIDFLENISEISK